MYGFLLSRRRTYRRAAEVEVLFLVSHGTNVFAGVKLAMTAGGIFTLVFLAKVHFLNRFRTGLFLTAFFSGYAILVCYELVHLFKLM